MDRRTSTYAYGFDNPIRHTDPDGMFGEDINDGDPVTKGALRTAVIDAGGLAGGVFAASLVAGGTVAAGGTVTIIGAPIGLAVGAGIIVGGAAIAGAIWLADKVFSNNTEGGVNNQTETDNKENHPNTGGEKLKIDRGEFAKQREAHWRSEWSSGRFK